MLLFAATGITLNHAGQIEASPHVSQLKGQLPGELLIDLRQARESEAARLPETLGEWFVQHDAIRIGSQSPEWSPEEMYLALPRPGGDAWLRIDMDSGEYEYELTERGWIAYLNDLHKGRNTGAAWPWFIDFFAVCCLIFCISGLLLLKMHAGNRASTWPVLAFGLLLPFVLIVAFVH